MSQEAPPEYIAPIEQPAPETPPIQQQPEPSAEVIAANARAEAFREIAMGRQPEPNAPAPEAPLPTNPLDLLDASGREKLELLRLSDAAAYSAQVGELAVKLAEARVARQAAPIIAGQAGLIVSNFKSRMMVDDPYARDVMPLFDTSINALGTGIRALVGMGAAQQDAELRMRWDAARNQVLERKLKSQQKPEPPPIGGGDRAAGVPNQNSYETTDPIIATMHRRYKFTPEQLAEINAGTL